jgi:serralysin
VFAPTADEQYMLELVNRARSDPAAEAARLGVSLGTITAAPKQPLAFDPDLIEAARLHSAWMLDADAFSHTGEGGSSAGQRMAAAGYQFTGSWTWGENIAYRGGAATATTVESLHDALFRSSGHRANILNATFREAGIGIEDGEYRGFTATMATQAFAKSGTEAFLTGVAFGDRDGDRFYDPGEGWGAVRVEAEGAGGATWTATTWDSGGYTLALPAGSYSVTFSGGALAAPVTKAVTVGTSNVKLDLTAADARPTGVALTGTAGDDRLTGGALDDVLAGGAGRDRLYGLGGDDRLDGGDGDDYLDGGAGRDALLGGAGNDWIMGNAGADVMTGGAGADRFVFTLVADLGNDVADFSRAQGDRIDVSLLLDRVGRGGAQGLADGAVRAVQTAEGARIDVAAADGTVLADVVTLQGVSAADVAQDWLVV